MARRLTTPELTASRGPAAKACLLFGLAREKTCPPFDCGYPVSPVSMAGDADGSTTVGVFGTGVKMLSVHMERQTLARPSVIAILRVASSPLPSAARRLRAALSCRNLRQQLINLMRNMPSKRVAQTHAIFDHRAGDERGGGVTDARHQRRNQRCAAGK